MLLNDSDSDSDELALLKVAEIEEQVKRKVYEREPFSLDQFSDSWLMENTR